MKHMSRIRLSGAFLGLLLMILDSRTAVSGAQEALELCSRTLIPSLFPFFVISSWMTPMLLGSRIPLLRPLGRLTGLPEGVEPLLAVGFLGGYPTGAVCVAEAFRAGRLSRADAERMLVFCSNAGPSFLFGILGSMFPEKWTVWLLWLIQITSALFCGFLLPVGGTAHGVSGKEQPSSLPDALSGAVRTIASVCGWVVIFRVLLSFLDRWVFWLLPREWTVVITGLLELTNGCCALPAVSGTGSRFLIASVLLSFGGLCVAMQTASAVEGLSIRLYLPGKLLQSAVSLFLALSVQPFLPDGLEVPVWPVLLTLSAAIALRYLPKGAKKKNRSSIPQQLGV